MRPARYHWYMTVRDLLEEALKLPPRERGKLVHELICSLDAAESEQAATVEQAWSAELEARAARTARGETVGKSADAVFADIRERLRSKP